MLQLFHIIQKITTQFTLLKISYKLSGNSFNLQFPFCKSLPHYTLQVLNHLYRHFYYYFLRHLNAYSERFFGHVRFYRKHFLFHFFKIYLLLFFSANSIHHFIHSSFKFIYFLPKGNKFPRITCLIIAFSFRLAHLHCKLVNIQLQKQNQQPLNNPRACV